MNIIRVKWNKVQKRDYEMVLNSIPVGTAVDRLPWDVKEDTFTFHTVAEKTLGTTGFVAPQKVEVVFQKEYYFQYIVWKRIR